MKYILVGAMVSIGILFFNVCTLSGIVAAQRAELAAANGRAAATQHAAAVCRDMIGYTGQPVILLKN